MYNRNSLNKNNTEKVCGQLTTSTVYNVCVCVLVCEVYVSAIIVKKNGVTHLLAYSLSL